MIALIPARGGSKGLPGKNIKLLNGKPMIAYTIEAALKSKKISRVILSTDDTEIARVGQQYGAEVPFMRPDYLATDTARSLDVFDYTITQLELLENIEINEFIILQPTSPLRKSIHIDEAITLFKEKNADSIISYCKEDHPIVWHKYIDNEGRFSNIFKDDFIKNRQEIKPTYYPNGSIFILKKEIINSGNYYQSNSFAYIMEKKYSIDIDTIDDFRLAQFLI